MGNFLRNTFLGRVLQVDRRLGWFFCAFAFVQIIAQLLTAEVTPFFLFGMYSDPIHPSPTYVRMRCEVDGAAITQEQLPRYAGELFFSTLYRFEQLDANENEDLFKPFIEERFGWLPEETKNALNDRLAYDPKNEGAFGDWMIRYLSRSLERPIGEVIVERETYRYAGQRPVLVETTELITAHAALAQP